MGEIIGRTESLCPICLEKIKAIKVKEDKNIYMVKECQDHGEFKTIIWKGQPKYERWKRPKTPAYPKTVFKEVSRGCPYDCGLCSEHRQHTWTALIEITESCNLGCKFCFANAGGKDDPDLDTIRYYYERILKAGGVCNIQLSGGEPTLREDLPEIIKLGHEIGFRFIQLNTNGIKLKDIEYVKTLKDAGLNSVFLQFDGLDDKIYANLRGKEILEYKLQAIENLKKVGIGTILVCTIVPGVNDSCLYDIVRFGVENMPTIRGVHFQPVSYFGRIPKTPEDEDRITLAEVMDKLSKQSRGEISMRDFRAPGCENAYCSFSGNFIEVDGKLVAIGTDGKSATREEGEIEDGERGALRAKAFVERNWAIRQQRLNKDKYSSFTDLLKKIETNRFSISAMAFQDVWNLDLERLRDCCIHTVSKEGNLIPFCAYNLTDKDGKGLYRNMGEDLE